MNDSANNLPDFQRLFESVPGLYLVLSPELEIVAVSDAYAEATMTRREEILGRGLFEVFPDNPDDPSADGVSNLRASLASVLNNRKTHTMAVQKYDIRRPDGSFEVRYWSPVNKPVFNARNELVYIIHRVEDVTGFVEMQDRERRRERATEELQRKVGEMEREIYQRSMEIKRMNEQLERKVRERTDQLVNADRRYHQIVDNMMEGMQVIDRDYCYLYVNEALVKQSKISSEDLLGNTMMECYPGIEQSEFFKTLRHCMENRVSRSLENEFRFPDGSIGYFALSIQPIEEGLFILSADITERKLAQRALEEQNRRLLRQNSELEQFAYVASHDLQEPLRSVWGFSELLQGRLASSKDAEAQKYLGFIMSSARRMMDLVSGLLEFSRLGRERKPGLIDCNRVVADALADLNASIQASRAEISVGRLPVLQGYGLELKQLFENLVGNALKFRHADIPPRIEISAEPQGASQWRFAVRDNGIGIEEKYKDKIFIIFQRLHKRDEYGGTGIGLAHCKKIVELHGGRIWVESTPGKGSVFYFTITAVPA